MTREIDVSERIDEGEIRSACASILASDAFLKAHRMRRLFRFLTEQALTGGKGNVSEYMIGIEVFDKDPKDYVSEDPVVRVQVGRLRQRLASYYADHAVTGNVEVSIPVGRYMPVFRRAYRPERGSAQRGYLMVQPIRYIAQREEGQAFASGLYEELLTQLFSAFGEVFMRGEWPSTKEAGKQSPANDDNHAVPHRLIEGSLRVDAERMRASIRLVDFSLSRITWARNFDRSVQFGIREQEELAASICHALREVVSL